MLTIDGSFGEGGGQILRTSLALSLCLQQPFRITNLRRQRDRPGLQRQHLAAVQAAATIGAAAVGGAELGSLELSFAPQTVRPGAHHFAIGTAGSTTLVLQTVLPALLTASSPSQLILEGGTHNPLAPSFDFLALAFLPLINRLGPRVTAVLERPGFYPAGGGRIRVEVQPAARLEGFELIERGAVRRRRACAALSHLPDHIAERELGVLARELGLAATELESRRENALGPGNAVSVVIECEHVTEVFTAFGERGVAAEWVAGQVAATVQRYLGAGVPVGDYLADQLLLPLALAGSGAFRTLKPTQHTMTNAAVIEQFTGRVIERSAEGPDCWHFHLS